MFFFASCSIEQDANTGYRIFFYPIEAFVSQSKIYKYSEISNIQNAKYLHMSAIIENNDTTLITKAYDVMYNLLSQTYEEIDSKGSRLSSYMLIVDSEEINSKVKDDKLFLWNFSEDEKIRSSVEYQVNEKKFEFLRIREDFKKDTIIYFQGKGERSHVFQDKFLFISENDTFQFSQKTYYSSGIGQIMYIRYYPDGKKETIMLEEIISEEEWQVMNKK